ncbi:hypothetical protein D3C72_2192750 [compost metagenome]
MFSSSILPCTLATNGLHVTSRLSIKTLAYSVKSSGESEPLLEIIMVILSAKLTCSNTFEVTPDLSLEGIN